ncbi:MAG: type II toxin-antitoxin system prevent-host-death family antitoxin [Sulfuricellaceae bacterium]|nr:type II toxin-antitoxin system prevent-host-death family antitoxin [Sulfuricellaceae bacterium]
MQINIYEAKSHFSELISRALTGEEVVIAKSGKPLVRLIPVAESAATNGVRFGGLAVAGVVIDDDFYTPLSDNDLLDDGNSK